MEARILSTEDIIRAALRARPGGTDQFRVPRGRKKIWAGFRRPVEVRTAAEKVLYLPNGSVVKVSVDDSGVATQIEETEHLHAIARPRSIHLNSFGRKDQR